MQTNIALAVLLGLLAGFPQTSAAESCLSYLANQKLDTNTVQLVTLNKNGVASSSIFGVSYRDQGRSPAGGVRPAQWFTDNTTEPRDVAKQLFSDRASAVGADKQQPFDIQQVDLISVIITVEASPQVTVTLRSWGNAKASFRATCSVGGVMHGSTPDVDYLLFLGQVVRR